MTNKEFWFWYYWLKFKEFKLIQLCTEVKQFKKLGVKRIYLN